MTKARVLLAGVLLAAALLIGCSETPTTASLRWEIEKAFPGVHLEKESHVKLGRITMGLAKKVARMVSDEDDDDLAILGHIKRVEVATYWIDGLPSGQPIDIPPRFEKRLSKSGFQTVVRQRDEDEQTWMLFREDKKGAIRNLYVVSLDSSELVVVGLQGRIDRVIADAMADEPSQLVEMFGP